MVGLFAQSSSSGDPVALFLPILLVSALAFIPASIAKKKGYSAGWFWVFGFLTFLIALIVALVLKDKTSASTAAPLMPAAVANSGITWTHTGIRYVTGYSMLNSYYGVWDRQQPGQPTARFPYTEHGKAEALARFRELEPNGRPLAHVPLPPPPAPTGGNEGSAARVRSLE